MKTVYLVVRDDSMLNEPSYGIVVVCAFSSEQLAQEWIDNQNIIPSSEYGENHYDPRFEPFPYSISEYDIIDDNDGELME